MSEGGEGPRPTIIRTGRNPDGSLQRRKGFPKPVVEKPSKIFNPDGSLKKIEPKPEVTERDQQLASFSQGFDDLLSHPIRTVRKWYTSLRMPKATPVMKDEIAGRTHPGTDAPFVDVPEKPYRWDDDPDIAGTTTPVTELANAATWQEVVEIKGYRDDDTNQADLAQQPNPAEVEAAVRRHPAGGTIEQPPATPPVRRLTVVKDTPSQIKPTPPDDNGGGTAA